MKYIHLNCDLGEGGEHDALIMPFISACNIACGGHAGTLETMRLTAALALKNNVQIGAHPSYPDKENFGRKRIKMEAVELKQTLVAQILSLKQIVEAEGGILTHIKPHGALYHDAANDENIAQIVIESVLEFDEKLKIFTSHNSNLSTLAQGQIEVVLEAFGDRNYQENYELVSRENSNALITEKEEVLAHLFSMIKDQKIVSLTGQKIPCFATTFCLHSDTPNVVEILSYLTRKLGENNIEISRL